MLSLRVEEQLVCLILQFYCFIFPADISEGITIQILPKGIEFTNEDHKTGFQLVVVRAAFYIMSSIDI